MSGSRIQTLPGQKIYKKISNVEEKVMVESKKELDQEDIQDIRKTIIESFKLKQEKLQNLDKEINGLQSELGVEGDNYSK